MLAWLVAAVFVFSSGYTFGSYAWLVACSLVKVAGELNTMSEFTYSSCCSVLFIIFLFISLVLYLETHDEAGKVSAAVFMAFAVLSFACIFICICFRCEPE